jgi:hypothetical protein
VTRGQPGRSGGIEQKEATPLNRTMDALVKAMAIPLVNCIAATPERRAMLSSVRDAGQHGRSEGIKQKEATPLNQTIDALAKPTAIPLVNCIAATSEIEASLTGNKSHAII